MLCFALLPDAIDMYCPVGSVEPHQVQRGYYSLTMRPSASLVATITGLSGSSSVRPLALGDGLGKEDLSLGHVRTTEAICDKGHYCIKGVRHPCPAGTYGETEGLTTAEW